MSDSVRPIDGVNNRPIENRPVTSPDGDERRKGDRRFMDRRAQARGHAQKSAKNATNGKGQQGDGGGRDMVHSGPADAAGSDAAASASPAAQAAAGGSPAAFAAQVIGQPGQKRGLKAGMPVRETARATYLETEFSGQRDRRPPLGARTRTEI